MRYLLSTASLVAFAIVASGCRNPTPNFNPYGGFGSPRVAPPATGSYPASGVPAQPGAYYPGVQQPASVPGNQPAYTSPAPATGYQSQNQQTLGAESSGWQASHGVSAGTASTAGMPETAVNRATMPRITNGSLNNASYQETNRSSNANPAAGLRERIERGRMKVHDATAPAGASAPVPLVPAYSTYPVPTSLAPTPSYTHLRGVSLTSTAAEAPAGGQTPPSMQSVRVAGVPSQPSESAAADTGSSNSADGLNWRSKQRPDMEVATR